MAQFLLPLLGRRRRGGRRCLPLACELLPQVLRDDHLLTFRNWTVVQALALPLPLLVIAIIVQPASGLPL